MTFSPIPERQSVTNPPRRLAKTLECLHQLAPDRKVAVARELTKKFEEFLLGTPSELIQRLTQGILKGRSFFSSAQRGTESQTTGRS